jgi:catechol 2,3-dioxygenase-like lactoylglutathione lyase family enzyme
MQKFRHIAFISKDPAKVYDYYHRLFGIEQVWLSPLGAVHVIDGLVNIAFIQQSTTAAEVANTHRIDGRETDQRQGINHYGFLVDNVDKVLSKIGGNLQRGQTPQDGRPAEMRVVDPWGNKIDISAKGYLGRDDRRLPGIRHVVIQTPSPDQSADFYKSTFELKEIKRNRDGSVLLSDGDVSVCLTEEQTIGKPGIQYFGIQVEDWSATEKRFQQIGLTLPAAEGETDEVKLRDPEGNLYALSQKGWQS